MKRKKIIYKLLIAAIIGVCFFVCNLKLYASEKLQNEIDSNQIIEYELQFFNWESINDLQNKLKETMPVLNQFDLKTEVTSMIKGDKRFSLQEIGMLIAKTLFQEIHSFIKVGIRFLLIVLLCNLLQTLSASFQSKNTTKICFFVCYIVILYSVVQSFVIMTNLAETAINEMYEIMQICIPTLLAFMTTSGYVSSSMAMAPVIIGAITASTYIIKTLVLPCIISLVAIEVISSLSEALKIDKLIKLFYRGIKWVLRSILIISIGILGFYKTTLPYMDVTIKKAAFNVTTTLVPVIGDASKGAIEFIMNCSFLIKNAFVWGVIILIILAISIPLIKILAYSIIYQIAGAIIEPLGDKTMANMATKLAKGSEFILSCVGSVGILCVTVLLICMSIGANIT